MDMFSSAEHCTSQLTYTAWFARRTLTSTIVQMLLVLPKMILVAILLSFAGDAYLHWVFSHLIKFVLNTATCLVEEQSWRVVVAFSVHVPCTPVQTPALHHPALPSPLPPGTVPQPGAVSGHLLTETC